MYKNSWKVVVVVVYTCLSAGYEHKALPDGRKGANQGAEDAGERVGDGAERERLRLLGRQRCRSQTMSAAATEHHHTFCHGFRVKQEQAESFIWLVTWKLFQFL
jgi:hypothetical protein